MTRVSLSGTAHTDRQLQIQDLYHVTRHEDLIQLTKTQLIIKIHWRQTSGLGTTESKRTIKRKVVDTITWFNRVEMKVQNSLVSVILIICLFISIVNYCPNRWFSVYCLPSSLTRSLSLSPLWHIVSFLHWQTLFRSLCLYLSFPGSCPCLCIFLWRFVCLDHFIFRKSEWLSLRAFKSRKLGRRKVHVLLCVLLIQLKKHDGKHYLL
jgi:hypothetical protein